MSFTISDYTLGTITASWSRIIRDIWRARTLNAHMATTTRGNALENLDYRILCAELFHTSNDVPLGPYPRISTPANCQKFSGHSVFLALLSELLYKVTHPKFAQVFKGTADRKNEVYAISRLDY